LDDIAYTYYEEWDKNKDKEIPTLKLPAPAGAWLIIHFSFASGYWANSVSLKSDTNEQLLLESVLNW